MKCMFNDSDNSSTLILHSIVLHFIINTFVLNRQCNVYEETTSIIRIFKLQVSLILETRA